MATLKRRSAQGVAATMAAQGIRVGLQFVSQIVLAHLLLPADFGLVAMIGPVLDFVQVFSELGLSQATIQKAEITQGELSALFWINASISLVLGTAMALSAPLVAAFYNEPRLAGVCVAIASLLVVTGLARQQIALLNRRMRFTSLATIDVLCAISSFAAGVAAAMAGFGYWSLVIMQAVNAVTILVMSWVLSGWLPSRPRRQAGIGGMLRFGGHLTGYNLINFAGTNLDSILIGKLGGIVALGLYDRAFRLVAAPMWQISLPVDRVASSLLSRLQHSPARYRSAFLQMLQVLLLVATPAVVFVAVAADTLVPLLLGKAWVGAAPIVSALAISTAFAPLAISSYWLFVSQARGAEQLRFVTIKTVIVLMALLIGIPWGALGVARSYALFAVLVNGLLLWAATRQGPVDQRSVLRAVYPVVLAAITSAIALIFVQRALIDAGTGAVLRLLAEAALSYAIFGVTLLCWPDGVRILLGVWQLRSLFAKAPASA